MKTIKNSLFLLQYYNALIKYQLRVSSENGTSEITIDRVFVNIDNFKTVVLTRFEQKDYSQEFIDLISRIFMMATTNSDLLAVNGKVEKELCRLYPMARQLEEFSFEVYQFLRDTIYEAQDEYGRSIAYEDFAIAITPLPEYIFKGDKNIHWSLYHFLGSVTDAYTKQEGIDFENQLSFKISSEKENFILLEKDKRAQQILELSTNFCPKDLPFYFIKDQLEKPNFYCMMLSDMLAKISLTEYAQYLQFDYSKYNEWDFSSRTLDTIPEFEDLPQFRRLVQILSNALVIKKYTEGKDSPKPVEQLSEEKSVEGEKVSKNIRAEYLLPVPILNEIYNAFNAELWSDTSLIDFLSVFTTSMEPPTTFSILHGQKTRFYYLLKKIWINSPIQSLFDSEKAWIDPLLNKLMTKKTSNKESKASTEKLIKDIRRSTAKVYSSEQKILIVMEGMRAELSIAELCRKYGLSQPTYYKWNKEFIEAGKKRLSGDETREATSGEVKELRKENSLLKESLADLVIRYDIVKKSLHLLD